MMDKKISIIFDTIIPGVMQVEENEVILQDLPTSVRGFVFQGEDGEPVIIVNSRLTREANRRTFRHEKKHIKKNEMYDPTYNEYKEGSI